MAACRAGRSRPLSTLLSNLIERIDEELVYIETAVDHAVEAWDNAQSHPEHRSHFLNSVALDLHSFYGGLEHLFADVARRLDGHVPSGVHWHRDLMEQMGKDVPGARPVVLLPETVDSLREYLAFRHRVRNLYSLDLDPDRLSLLVEHLPGAWDRAKNDLARFCDLLKAAASRQAEE